MNGLVCVLFLTAFLAEWLISMTGAPPLVSWAPEMIAAAMVPIVALRLAPFQCHSTEIHLSVQRYVGAVHDVRRHEHSAIRCGYRGSAHVL